MENTFAAVLEKPVAKSTCNHHWIIEAPVGPSSKGICKICGAEKEFSNSFENLWLENDTDTQFRLPDFLDTETGDSLVDLLNV